jgi:lipopolysaccharide transport system ATP-binding protein
MSDDITIRVRGLGKKYTIGGPQEQYHTLRDAIVNSVKAPFNRFSSHKPFPEFWALKDVSYDVEQRRGCGDYRAEWCGEVDAA